jgi:imidazolonepropionase-like amidohydrolase
MRKIVALLLILLLQGLVFSQTTRVPPTRPLVLTHVTVIDVTGAPSKPDMIVIIEGNRIAAVGRTGKVRIPKNAQVVDASAKFLIPGLWDMHVHTLIGDRPSYFFSLFLANGVTGVRDMGGSLTFEQIDQIRRDIAAGRNLGPRIFTPGRILDATGGQHPDISVAADTPEQGREFVRSFKQQGADFLKVYDLLSRDVYLSIFEEAKKQGMPLEGHVPFAVSAAEAADLGQKSIEHTTGIFISSSRDEEVLRKELVASSRAGTSLSVRQRVEVRAIDSNDARKEAALFRRFARNGTWQCPTLVVRRSSVLTDENQLLADPRLKYIPLPVRQRWQNLFKERLASADESEGFKKRYRKTLEIVGAMYRAKVGILAGTDIFNPYLYPGFSLHDELALLVQAGLTPLEALQTATINPAKFFGKEKELGTIEKGKLADLVLLDANPLEDIGNTQRINAVIVNGRYLPQETLRKLLVEVEAIAKRGRQP